MEIIRRFFIKSLNKIILANYHLWKELKRYFIPKILFLLCQIIKEICNRLHSHVRDRKRVFVKYRRWEQIFDLRSFDADVTRLLVLRRCSNSKAYDELNGCFTRYMEKSEQQSWVIWLEPECDWYSRRV